MNAVLFVNATIGFYENLFSSFRLYLIMYVCVCVCVFVCVLRVKTIHVAHTPQPNIY